MVALPLVALQAISVGGTVASPTLIDSPLLLVSLTPRLPFLAVAARDSALLPFLAVATARLCVADPIHFGIGRRLTAWSPGPTRHGAIAGAVVRRVHRTTQGKYGRVAASVLVFARPISRHLTLAGAAGVRGRTVAAIDVVATLIYLIAIKVCGDALW